MGPVVIITGCSTGGIGHALACAFAEKKCRVVATSRSRSSMVKLENDNRFLLEELDVQSDESVRRVVDGVVETYGRIDVLVNNAGIQCVAPLAEVPLSTVQNSFDTNVFDGAFYWAYASSLRMVQAVVPHMATRKKGKIVNIGSCATLAPGPWSGTYTASKAALHALTDTLRICNCSHLEHGHVGYILELGLFGIDVVNVLPGAIRSNVVDSATASYNRMPEWKLFKPFEAAIRDRASLSQKLKSTLTDEFARNTVAAILKEKPPAWFTYGHYSTVMAIMYHLPFSVRDFILKKAMKC